jgi:hypothetical protein
LAFEEAIEDHHCGADQHKAASFRANQRLKQWPLCIKKLQLAAQADNLLTQKAPQNHYLFSAVTPTLAKTTEQINQPEQQHRASTQKEKALSLQDKKPMHELNPLEASQQHRRRDK